MTSRIIKPNEIHLWYQKLDPRISPSLTRAHLEALPDHEREKYFSFLVAPKKLEYLLTRTLVRKVLSNYSDVSPNQWRFEANTYGRPHVAFPKLELPIQFNLSHCHGLAVCAVALDSELGVDVEYVNDTGDLLKLAEHNFSDPEIAALQALPPKEQAARFYQYWTLKEAYLKARGIGLSLSVQKFSFHIKPGEPIGFTIQPGLDPNPQAWRFSHMNISENHQLALAIRKKQDSKLQIIETWESLAA